MFAFDCLYHNGTSLLHEPLTKRRDLLHTALKEVPGQVLLATTKISNDVEELEVRGSCCFCLRLYCRAGVCRVAVCWVETGIALGDVQA